MVLEINGSPANRVNVRNPWAVLGLTIITLGLYQIYWWYQVNREMADVGRAWNTTELGDNPTLSGLAMFPGSLLIVPYVMTMYGGVQRIKALQRYSLGVPTINGWVLVAMILSSVILLVPSLLIASYVQFELNKAWSSGRVPLTAPSPVPLPGAPGLSLPAPIPSAAPASAPSQPAMRQVPAARPWGSRPSASTAAPPTRAAGVGQTGWAPPPLPPAAGDRVQSDSAAPGERPGA